MGMYCSLLSLSQAQIGALRAKPSLASKLVMAIQYEQLSRTLAVAMDRMPPERKEAAELQYRAAIEQLSHRMGADAQRAAAGAEPDPMAPLRPPLDLGKSWHILHYLFTGRVDVSNTPADSLLTGEDMGEDLGDGPARLHDADETRAFARFLQTLDPERLQQRVNYREMLRVDVYAVPMGRGTDDAFERELRGEVAAYFPHLRDYVARTADEQGGLLIWLS